MLCAGIEQTRGALGWGDSHAGHTGSLCRSYAGKGVFEGHQFARIDFQGLRRSKEHRWIRLALLDLISRNHNWKMSAQAKLPHEKVNATSAARAGNAQWQVSALQFLHQAQQASHGLDSCGFFPEALFLPAPVLCQPVSAQLPQKVAENVIALSSIHDELQVLLGDGYSNGFEKSLPRAFVRGMTVRDNAIEIENYSSKHAIHVSELERESPGQLSCAAQ